MHSSRAQTVVRTETVEVELPEPKGASILDRVVSATKRRDLIEAKKAARARIKLCPICFSPTCYRTQLVVDKEP